MLRDLTAWVMKCRLVGITHHTPIIWHVSHQPFSSDSLPSHPIVFTVPLLLMYPFLHKHICLSPEWPLPNLLLWTNHDSSSNLSSYAILPGNPALTPPPCLRKWFICGSLRFSVKILFTGSHYCHRAPGGEKSLISVCPAPSSWKTHSSSISWINEWIDCTLVTSVCNMQITCLSLLEKIYNHDLQRNSLRKFTIS